MARHRTSRFRAGSRYSVAKRLTLAGSAVAVALLAGSFPPPLVAQGQVLSDDQIAAASKPATVLLLAQYHSTVSFPKATFSSSGMAALRAYREELQQRGLAPRAIAQAVLQELAQNPLRFLVASQKTLHKETATGWRGSGFIVTPDGYIVTNAHVVSTPRDTLEKYLVQQGLHDLLVSDLKQFSDALDFEMTDEMNSLFVTADIQYYLRYLQLGPVTQTITAQMGSAGPFSCDIRKVGTATPGKDVAVLKIEQHDLPTVPLGDDSRLRTGSHVVVLGYPAAADLPWEGALPPGFESTLTQGDVSARRTMPGGWEAIQTSAEINGGNSGGPAFNDRGEVIGVATFGPEAKGINFLVPASVVQEFLNEINVKPQEGSLSQLYRAALVDFDARHYKRALDKFQQINNLSPTFPFVQKYITDAQREISAGHDRGMVPLPLGMLAALVVALAVVVVGGVWMMRRRAVAGATAGAAPMGAPRTRTRVEQGPAALPRPAAGSLPERSFGSIECIAGAAQGRRFPITKQGLLIGRDAGRCQVVLPDDAVSKEHAWVVPVEDGVVVMDRGSTNGVFVNSTDAPRVSKVRLQHGDRIYIGQGAAVFTYLSS